MTDEQLAAAAVLVVLGVGVATVGVMGRRGSLQYSLGEWTRSHATGSSWSRAHHTIGTGFLIAGLVAIGAAAVVLLAPAGATGPVTVAGSVVMLGPVVVGIALGFRRLERRG